MSISDHLGSSYNYNIFTCIRELADKLIELNFSQHAKDTEGVWVYMQPTLTSTKSYPESEVPKPNPGAPNLKAVHWTSGRCRGTCDPG